MACAGGLALLLSAAPSGAAAETALALRYDVYYLSFRVLAMESRTVVAEDAYRMNSSMRTVGIIGTLFPWESQSAAFGDVKDARLVPASYRMDSRFRERALHVDLSFRNDGVVGRVDGDLGEEDLGMGRRDPVPEALRAGTVDPLTAVIGFSRDFASTGACGGTRRVFDGVRRYDLIYEDRGETVVDAGASGGFSGAARLCRARVEPIAGFLQARNSSDEGPMSIVTWLGSPLAGVAVVPVRLDIEGRLGTLRAYLQSATLEPSPGAPPASLE